MPRASEYYYHQNIKNLIATFGIIFRDVVYIDDFNNTRKVPIHYAPKEKFVEMINAHAVHDDGYEYSIQLPRFGFELSGLIFDPSRNLNPLSILKSCNEDGEYMFNRVPYNFDFTLYLGTRKFETGLKIVEQILPFFSPELNVSLKDMEQFGIITDVPFTLSSVNPEVDYLGSFDTARTIVWTLNFQAKAFLYKDIKRQNRIKETIIKLGNEDFSHIYETLTSVVDPRDAEQDEPHNIIDSIISGDVEIPDNSFNAVTGESLTVEIEQGEQPLHIRDIQVGEEMMTVEFF